MTIDISEVIRDASWLRGIQTCIADSYTHQLMRCPVHLSIGQELLWAVLKQFRTMKLKVFSSHRGHLPYLTMDGDLKRYVAELHLHPDGASGGQLGSMHIKSPKKGHHTSVPIVGSAIPLAVGAAYACKQLGQSWISIAHFGDGACEEGILHESLNLASIKTLPVLFLCENNRYSCTTVLARRQPSSRMARFADAACIESCTTSSECPDSLVHDVGHALKYIKDTGKPYFLEVECYRLYEHCGPSVDTDCGDRTPSEYRQAVSRDFVTSNLDLNIFNIAYDQCKSIVEKYSAITTERLKRSFR
jgi:TPP-dependent pyruvate/acetoin dehydrogenase alpha subunit